MPSGTGKTITLLSLIVAYQMVYNLFLMLIILFFFFFFGLFFFFFWYNLYLNLI